MAKNPEKKPVVAKPAAVAKPTVEQKITAIIQRVHGNTATTARIVAEILAAIKSKVAAVATVVEKL